MSVWPLSLVDSFVSLASQMRWTYCLPQLFSYLCQKIYFLPQLFFLLEVFVCMEVNCLV